MWDGSERERERERVECEWSVRAVAGVGVWRKRAHMGRDGTGDEARGATAAREKCARGAAAEEATRPSREAWRKE